MKPIVFIYGSFDIETRNLNWFSWEKSFFYQAQSLHQASAFTLFFIIFIKSRLLVYRLIRILLIVDPHQNTRYQGQ